jgi:nucleotide-binding universal stress UspA family protein
MTIRKVLAAYDFSEPAGRALRWAHALASQTGATLEVVHVHRDLYDGRSTPELGLPWPSPGQEERYLRFLEQELKNALTSVLGPLEREIPVHVVRGDPVKRVVATAEERGADLVCIGSTGKGGVARVMLGSISENVLRTSPVPVLIVH